MRYGLGPDATVADVNAARTGGEASDFESVVALPTFEAGRLVTLKLHPISLGAEDDASTRGRPKIADAEQGRRIIERIAEMSERFGTVVEWQPERGVGVVRVRGAS